MPRFVILRHELPPGAARGSHWDLMFEQAGVLRTWAVDEIPSSTAEIEAQLLADHRLAYLDYEGPVSGDRGSVTRWDGGDYTLECDEADRWIVRASGARLRGRLTLRAAGPHSWRVSFSADPTSG
jgi:hypothetical protein